jgi:DNA-directed RNA polymerase specialized sigma24 family protein
MSTIGSRAGDETVLFAELHPKLARQVRRLVRTREENVQDACSFAFLQAAAL